MKKLIVILSLMLAGCGTFSFIHPAEKIHLPDAPHELVSNCPKLEQLKEGANTADVLQTSVDNSKTYSLCAGSNDGWVKFYTNIQKTYNK